jgi:hypothetical protein
VRDELAQRLVELPDVILDKLGQGGHVMRTAECFD